MLTSTDIRQLWDFNNPAESEKRFQELAAQVSTDLLDYWQLQTQIARTHSLRGNFEQAHSLLDKVAPLINFAPLIAIRYALERGRCFNSSGAPEKALAYFQEAYELAQANQADDLAVDALHMLAIAETSPEQQIFWNRQALDLIAKSEQAEAQRWAGSIYNNLAWTYHEIGAYEQALEYFRKALDWHETHGTIPNQRIARWSVARCLRSLGQLEDALGLQEALRQDYENSHESDGFVYEELAECLLSLGRNAEAKPYFQLAYQELAQISWLDAERLARLQLLGESL